MLASAEGAAQPKQQRPQKERAASDFAASEFLVSRVAAKSGRPAALQIPRLLTAPGAVMTAPDGRDAADIALDFLRGQSHLFGLNTSDIEGFRVSSRAMAGSLEVVRLQQFHESVPVLRGQVRVAVDRQGQVALAGADDVIPALALGVVPTVSAAEALQVAGRSVGFELADGVTPQLIIVPANGRGRLAWRMFPEGESMRFEVHIGADEPDVLLRRGLSVDMGSARVWRDSPLNGDRELVVFPEGWLPPTSTVTRGNNADAFLDTDGNLRADNADAPGLTGGRATSETQTFDFPAGTGFESPEPFQAASVTSAFYWANLAHDHFYELGFREADGNFQQDNFGRGGAGSDEISVSVHNFRSRNNASFMLAPEGQHGTIRVGLFFKENDVRDGALSGDLMIHEYAHGVTSRLVGGPDSISCLAGPQEAALSEGWSDYFAISFFNDPVAGEYEGADIVAGVRRFPYDQNPMDYSDLGETLFEEHDDGEIFAAALWDLREAIGGPAAEQLVVDSLKLAPCDPSFIDARDAMLAVDLAAGSPNRGAIWTAFARRGMGSSARGDTFAAGYQTLFDSAFDLPPDLDAVNRPARIRSRPEDPAALGEPFRYRVDGFDAEGDPIRYSLLDGPEGAAVDAASGELTWTGNFTGARFQIGLDDGRGGESTHGFLLRSLSTLTTGAPVTIDGPEDSIGLASFIVPIGAPLLQVTLRGDNGDPDVRLFDPGFELIESFELGANETITVADPDPGLWFVAVDGLTAYENTTLLAELPAIAQLALDEPVVDLAGAETSERFFRIDVPARAPQLVVTLAKGQGDPDIFLQPAAAPLCGFGSNNQRDAGNCGEAQGRAVGPFERVVIENPEPGAWFIAIVGFQAYSGVRLEASLDSSTTVLNAAVDGAGFTAAIGIGGVATVFGDNFADRLLFAGAVPLPRELGGVQVIVDGLAAPLFSLNRTQINFQIPLETIAGPTNIQVYSAGGLSPSIVADVRLLAPQIFSYARPDGVVDPVIAHADGSLVTPENPARPGETVIVYLTGMALVNNLPGTGEAGPAGPLATSLIPAEASAGGIAGTTTFAGLAPGFVGVLQVNIRLPDNLARGARVDFSIRFGNTATATVGLSTAP